MKAKILAVMTLLAMVIVTLLGIGELGVAPPVGQVEALQLRSTLWGIRQAATGQPGTMLMMKDQAVVFLWTVKDAWAFTGVNFAGQPQAIDFVSKITNGNLVNARDMSDIVRFMEGIGFQQVTPDKLPPAIITAAAQGVGWLADMAQRMVTILVVPAGIFTLPEEYQSYEG